MTIAISFRHWIASLGFIAVLGLGSASAQEISDAHLQAAKKAIAAIHATDQFDSFLSTTALQLQNELLRKDPDLETVISQIVNEQIMALVPRRADLQNEAARAYAKYFTEDELNQVANFYNSEAGKKLLTKGPSAMNDVVSAYGIWSQGISQDLAVNVGKELASKVKEIDEKSKADSDKDNK